MPDRDAASSFEAEAGLFSYSQILHLLKIEFSRARRYSYPLTTSVFIIDRLENLKDLYGYKIRDQIVERVVGLVHELSRTSDFLGKFGERLILILPHTDGPGVKVLMERVQERLDEISFEVDERPVHVTLSAGISTYEDKNTLFYDSILKNAAEALRQALERGGNCAVVYTAKETASPPPESPTGRPDPAPDRQG